MTIIWKKVLKSEYGFSPIIIMALLFFLSFAIVGGSYYVKNFTNILKSEASEEVPVEVNQENLQALKEEVVPINPTPPPTQNISSNENVIFYNANNIPKGLSGMKKINLNTEKEEAYLKTLEDQNNLVVLSLPSPSLKKSIVATIEKSALQPNQPPILNQINYYICLDDTCINPQLLDKSTVAANLTFKNYWLISNWVNNSETKLIITAYPRDPIENPFQRTEIAVLDLQTMEVKTLLSDYFNITSTILLDPTLDIMIATNLNPAQEPVISTYNLIDNKRTDFPAGKIKNYHYFDYGNTNSIGSFYVQAKNGEIIGNIKNLEVYSISGNLISSISVPESDNSFSFNPNISWSHSNNHFFVLLDIQSSQSKKGYVYTKEGSIVGSFELPLAENSSGVYIKNVIFSSDDKKVLINSIDPVSSTWNWKVFPIERNAKMQKELNSQNLGVPVVWN